MFDNRLNVCLRCSNLDSSKEICCNISVWKGKENANYESFIPGRSGHLSTYTIESCPEEVNGLWILASLGPRFFLFPEKNQSALLLNTRCLVAGIVIVKRPVWLPTTRLDFLTLPQNSLFDGPLESRLSPEKSHSPGTE